MYNCHVTPHWHLRLAGHHVSALWGDTSANCASQHSSRSSYTWCPNLSLGTRGYGILLTDYNTPQLGRGSSTQASHPLCWWLTILVFPQLDQGALSRKHVSYTCHSKILGTLTLRLSVPFCGIRSVFSLLAQAVFSDLYYTWLRAPWCYHANLG